jgi:hypothetical protein
LKRIKVRLSGLQFPIWTPLTNALLSFITFAFWRGLDLINLIRIWMWDGILLIWCLSTFYHIKRYSLHLWFG